MFGHQDEENEDATNTSVSIDQPATDDSSASDAAQATDDAATQIDPATEDPAPTTEETPAEDTESESTPDASSTDDKTATDDEPSEETGAVPTSDDTADSSSAPELPASDDASTPAAPLAEADKDLLNIKQEALQQLSPLVDHLDQSPEEKFHTTMMMIQAADNQVLIPAAFEAAKGINDDKTRAQALLDIVNEINYFTQSKISQ